MRVLVLGATGVVGGPIAQAFVRAGHYVVGLTRSQAKAKQLAADEIVPIIGEPTEPEKWINVVRDLDVVVEAVGGTAEIWTLAKKLLETISKAATELRPAHAPKLTYIYTSGTWVHGEDRETLSVSDTTPLFKSAELVSWRPAVEQLVVKDQGVNGIVVRPALLYGRSGSLLAPLFQSASEGKIVWPGTPGGRYALIHMDDLADLYLRAAERAPLVGGQIFDAASDFTESQADILFALAKVSGAKSHEFSPPANNWELALSQTTNLRPYLARSLLGWQPRKAGLVDHLPIYYAAWQAAQ
ncbi:nad dependent epimerase dehydratase family protein [Moniliophthora roreri]|uniref:NAD-dependent epimerase/dehydratase domain-containing protein n=3 Tax=Moniliophthora roreri TaxID=221103 RepID=A0A0W0G8Y3_MONRR|nr:nad dependent epimerase dehydratase family protein [Moniliophthora roreri]